MVGESERIIEILCAHCGREVAVDEVEIVPDGLIFDLYAARVGGEVDYLVHLSAGYVEEVVFDDWPPGRRREAGQPSAEGESGSEQRGPGAREESSMRIEDVMSGDVSYCRPQDSLESCARQMWENDCGSVPVCSGEDDSSRVVGMITDRDICMCALHEGKPLSALTVGEAMSRDLASCRPGDDTDRVEQLMRQRQIRRLPVCDNEGALVGIVSLADLARAASGDGNGRSRGDLSEAEIGDTLAAICKPNARSSRAEPRV